MVNVKEFFDEATWTLTYVVWDPKTRDAVVIDPVLDYDPASSKTSEKAVTAVLSFLKANELKLHYILETHAHADHISGSQVIKREYPSAKIAIGERITVVQKRFGELFGISGAVKADGSQFDHLLRDLEVVEAGSIKIKTIFTPGHTPACSTYLIDENAFVGDALFMPDYGTGRCDFPDGSAENLYESVHNRIYGLPANFKIYTGHDYLPNGRELKFVSTVDEEKRSNIHITADTKKEDFVHFRKERDKTLSAPRLLLPSVQVNIDAGRLPEPDKNGTRYLKIPIS